MTIHSVARNTAAVILPAVFLAMASPACAQIVTQPAIAGRWDLVVTGAEGPYPSWLEVTVSGFTTLVGRFVGHFGSARPVGQVDFANGAFSFAIPKQWEQGNGNLKVEGKLEGDRLTGTMIDPDGSRHPFTGSRAPALVHATPAWGAPVVLFNGKDLTGWTTYPGAGPSRWRVVNGVLANAGSGASLRTTQTYGDFKLHVELRYPASGNSGIYLRGRHEVQIEDSPRRDYPLAIDVGGVYGFLAPNENAATGAGQWQTFDITLVGRRVTVVLNGRTVVADQIIPGITGGAMDSNEGAPGPIILQGDHTAVEFRAIRIVPAK